jgi:DNA gyrase subunit A
VLLATRDGKAIRFMGSDIREFQSRASTGVRAMRLLGDDKVISLSILHRSGATSEEREAYLKAAPWKDNESEPTLAADRMAELQAKEQFIFTICANGYGKISSAYEYRRTGRGGQGITNIGNIERNGAVVASFPVKGGQQLMLVTDQAKLIRTPLQLAHLTGEGEEGGFRIIGRNSAGVRIFKVADEEHVVSAALIEGEDEAEAEGDEAAVEAAPTAE